ncbi:MAG: FliA/WhiG family RNA polymerase sigma factor [Candidatus Glassbacteria bacterium]|nr:FliA/WhiG family RNA polymerase sigma factor [Candidatus Glassbacteria bacterium]
MIAEYRESGDLKTKEKILLANMPLISYISERLAVSLPHSVEIDDLKSLGILGLIDAIENYKPEKQVRFTSYAALRIKGSIIDGLRSLDWVPRSVRKKARNLEKMLHQLEGELGRPVTEKEMAARLGVELGEYQSMLEEVSPISFLSLNDTVYEDGDQAIRLGDVIEDADSFGPYSDLERKEVKQILVEGINALPEREKLVLALYYYEELTLKEIGEVMQISESRVCQIHTEAMLRLRGKLRHSL